MDESARPGDDDGVGDGGPDDERRARRIPRPSPSFPRRSTSRPISRSASCTRGTSRSWAGSSRRRTRRCWSGSPARFPGRGPTTAGAVYKPIRGERPLWDFPEATLAHREVAAHAVSEATGWQIVPPTVFRADGPLGPGMLQLWVETREDVDILELLQSGDPRLRRIALFDAVVNNADRKGGHLLVRPDGLIQGVDHGVTFNVDPKLRTILWGWRGTPIAPDELLVLAALRPRLAAGGPLSAALAEHLDPAEIEQARARLDGLLESGTFPQPHPDWPAVPWPWY